MATVSQTYYGGGFTARLDAGAWGAYFRVAVPRTIRAAALRLEVLWQPRHAGGWPDGAARLLCDEVGAVFPGANDRPDRALFVLPTRLSPEFLAECHFRVRAVELSAPPSARKAA